MTWIVGTSSPLGYAAAVSDIQVSWPNGQTLDCLQKIYPALPTIAFGFAGSVKIGFILLNYYKTKCARGLRPGDFRSMRVCAHRWYRRARWIFGQLPDSDRSLGSKVVLLGAMPSRVPGEFPRANVVVLGSDVGFEPHYCQVREHVGIGSGNAVNEYVEEIRRRNQQGREDLRLEHTMPLGGKLAFDVAYVLKKYPIRGISRHVQHTVVSVAGVTVGEPQAVRDFGSDGLPVSDPAPSIARTWEEFQEIAFSRGLAAVVASG